MAQDTTRAETWIYGQLHADSQLTALIAGRIYGYRVDQGAALPAVVFQQQAGTDVTTQDATRVWTSLLYIVKAVGQTASWTSLDPIASRIDALLHKQNNDAGPGQIYRCYRERPFALAEVTDGIDYRHLGGYYRLLVQPG